MRPSAAALQGLLSKWHAESASGNKVLIFSRSTRCLDLLEVRKLCTYQIFDADYVSSAGWSVVDSGHLTS
jgi:hypothetical protein